LTKFTIFQEVIAYLLKKNANPSFFLRRPVPLFLKLYPLSINLVNLAASHSSKTVILTRDLSPSFSIIFLRQPVLFTLSPLPSTDSGLIFLTLKRWFIIPQSKPLSVPQPKPHGLFLFVEPLSLSPSIETLCHSFLSLRLFVNASLSKSQNPSRKVSESQYPYLYILICLLLRCDFGIQG